MSDDDIYEEVVASTADVNISPHLNEGESPINSSGVSSQGGSKHPSPAVPVPVPAPAGGKRKKAPKEVVDIKCTYTGCKKKYKTTNGFNNHIFTHKMLGKLDFLKVYMHMYKFFVVLFVNTIQLLFLFCCVPSDANIKKPSVQIVNNHVHGFVAQILREIMEEPNIQEEKLSLVKEALESQGSSSWALLIKSLSKLITESLSKRTKVLPTNQYQEFLSELLQ